MACVNTDIFVILMHEEIQEYFPFALYTLFHIKFHHHRVVAKNATVHNSSSSGRPSLLVKCRYYLNSD